MSYKDTMTHIIDLTICHPRQVRRDEIQLPVAALCIDLSNRLEVYLTSFLVDLTISSKLSHIDLTHKQPTLIHRSSLLPRKTKKLNFFGRRLIELQIAQIRRR